MEKIRVGSYENRDSGAEFRSVIVTRLSAWNGEGSLGRQKGRREGIMSQHHGFGITSYASVAWRVGMIDCTFAQSKAPRYNPYASESRMTCVIMTDL